MLRRRYVAGLAALGAALGTTAAVAAQGGSAAATCTPAQNIAVILDDSGSMVLTDQNTLRVAGVKLLLSKQGNQKKTMSALQFGSDASAVFPPGLIGQQKAAMAAALDAQIKGDDGATNYNAAFDLRKTQNPNADRIIFLTDGGHNIGDYANGHQGGPPVDVVGFSQVISGEDGTRLQQIANETGGTYHPQTDSSNLQAVMNEIDATENCQAAPKAFTDQFTALGQTKSHAVVVAGATKTIDMVLSWASLDNQFDLAGAKIVSHGRTVAVAKARKLKVKRTKGTTFETIRITRVKKGKLKFKLKVKKFGAPTLGGPTSLTTQVTQGGRR